MSKKQLKKRDFTKIQVNGKHLEVLQVLGIEVPVWRDPERGEVWVFMRPVVEQLGLSWASQTVKLRQDSLLSKGVSIIETPSQGGLQETLFLGRAEFIAWLFRLQPARIREEVRASLREFQLEAMRALDRYFAQGVAVNQRLLQESPETASQVAKNFSKQLEGALSEERRAEMLLQIASMLGESKYKERILLALSARLLGDASLLPAPSELPLDLTEWTRQRLSERGISLPYEKMRRMAQAVGQRASRLHREQYGSPPERRTQEVNGVVRVINAYYPEKHEELLETALEETINSWRRRSRL